MRSRRASPLAPATSRFRSSSDIASKARAAARERVAKLVVKRLAAVKAAQESAESMAKALTRVHEIAADERQAAQVAGNLSGVVMAQMGDEAIARRFGRYLSEALRSVPAASSGRYGEMGLARAFRVESDWVTAERKVSAHMTDGEHDG